MYSQHRWTRWLFLLSAATMISAASPDNQVNKWVISQNSSLCVNGSTNINKFACEVPAYDQADTLILIHSTDKAVRLTGYIELKIQRFDCHNAIMTHDLRNTLKDKQYPLMRINFLTLSELPELCQRPKNITGLVNIELAGTSKRFEINYLATADAQRNVCMIGTRDINFSDFNLTPPRKLGGMIRTNDKLSVQFRLNIKSLNTPNATR